MAKKKTTIRFWLREDRKNKDGTCPIHVIYQISGQRKYFAVPDLILLPVNWDGETQRVKYVNGQTSKAIDSKINTHLLLYKKDVDEANQKLDGLETDIRSIENNFNDRGREFTVAMVIDALKEAKEPNIKKDIPGESVADFILKFANETTAREHKSGTVQAYKGLAAHIKEFERVKSKKVTFSNLDTTMLKKFHAFLEEPKIKDGEKVDGVISITSAKIMSTLKTLLNYARKSSSKIEVNPDYKDYKVPRNTGNIEVISLTDAEFMAVVNLDLTANSALDRVRDFWVLSITTGFRYSDLEDLKREHISADGVIRKVCVKTKQNLEVPLNPFSAAIVEKYAKMERPVPVITNQKANLAIKKIGLLAGIDSPLLITRQRNGKTVTTRMPKYERLSCHVGRKSFITLSLEKGAAAQDVMALSGHTTWPAFKRYVDVTSNRKKEVMAKAWGEVEPKTN